MVTEVGERSTISMDTSESREPAIQWRFAQVKGDNKKRTSSKDDVISCVEFSHDGEYIAVGDEGGRVVVFRRDQSVCLLAFV
ncbi:hypothetical protein KIN20_023863 [Parelaphostrongylus tenuis]|uniref:Uncharacterized protein n=1 Tax=Parelaphostrongylus tenuis TaxID=148309 RepID=A0AAD5MSE5_PARTN|nr:hypothetical protein KIN20_023863 [Parelaphostrongylus tenuis]